MLSPLTGLPTPFMLCPLSPHVKDGICTPRKGEKSPLSLMVFFRPSFFIRTGLIRAKSIMVGCFRGLYESARSFAGSANLTQSTAQLFAPTGGGLFTSQRNTAMSHHQTASSTQHKINPDQDKNQAPIVLNHRTVTALRYWLERAKQHAHDLVDEFSSHENDLDIVELGIEISLALGLLNKPLAEEQTTVTITPPAKTSPEEQTTSPQRQTTYRDSKDPRGYDIRILCDVMGIAVQVNPNNAAPEGNEQVCLCCGNRDFVAGATVCPDCDTEVKYRCRYVAIAGSN